jgi:tripartite-type tricarboxylate transporter receptor subunit TctC
MRKHTLFAALTSVALLAVATGAAAQTPDDFPNRPIRIIVPQAAGSGVDLQARVLAQKMGELWGQQGVVENRPGANAIIGMETVAKAKPDGYTLVYAPVSAVTTNAFIFKKLPYDTFRDFVPITQTTTNPLGAVVNPASGIKSIKDLVERAKANPGQLNYGSFGIGNMTHLMGVLLSLAADIKMTHVPYSGMAPALNDLLAGHVEMMFDNLGNSLPLVQERKLKGLAVTGDKRAPELPDLPAIAETYPEVQATSWFGVVAPPRTPPEIAGKLSQAFAEILRTPEVEKRWRDMTLTPVGGTPEEIAAFFKVETERWRKVIVSGNIKPD